MSLRPRALPGSSRLYYGWVVAAIASLAYFFSGPGQTYSISIFIDGWMAEFGWTRTELSGLYSTATLIAGFTMVVVGKLVDRFGVRASLVAVALLFAGASVGISQARGMAMLFAGLVLVRILGQGSLTLIPYSLVPQWFVAQRGRAVALVSLGGMAASATFPYLNLQLLEAWGWRTAWQVWALLLAGILAPMAWHWVRNRPEEMGLLPDNAPRAQSSQESAAKSREEPSFTLAQAARTPVFWLLLIVTGVPPMVGTGAIFHHMSLMSANGLSPTVAALVFTVSAAVAFPATLVAGYASDRIPTQYMLALTAAFTGLATLWLLIAVSPLQAVILGVLRGLQNALNATVSGVVWPAYFGRDNLASLRGAATTAMVVASALGPLPFGLIYDQTGGYLLAILLMTAISMAGALVALYLRPPSARMVAASGRGAAARMP